MVTAPAADRKAVEPFKRSAGCVALMESLAKDLRTNGFNLKQLNRNIMSSRLYHTLNGDILATKLADGNGRVAKLIAAKKTHDEIVTELYLATLSRRPSPSELEASRKLLAESPSPQECYQDLLWALVNSKQFRFVR